MEAVITMNNDTPCGSSPPPYYMLRTPLWSNVIAPPTSSPNWDNVETFEEGGIPGGGGVWRQAEKRKWRGERRGREK